AIRFRGPSDESALLTLPRLLERLRTLSGRPLGEVEAAHAAALLDSIAPVEIAICDTALNIAAATLGQGLHASPYAAVLRAPVPRARTQRPPGPSSNPPPAPTRSPPPRAPSRRPCSRPPPTRRLSTASASPSSATPSPSSPASPAAASPLPSAA